ncbi:BatD family protein [Spirochaetota bacterium]
MAKIGKAVLVFSLILCTAYAQSMTVTLNKNKIGIQDLLVATVTLNGFEANPAVHTADFKQARSPETSTQIALSGAQVKRTITYSIFLRPVKTGTCTIQAVIAGSHKKGPFQVEVVDGSLNQQQQQQNPFNDPFFQDPFKRFFGRQQKQITKDDIFVVIIPSKRKCIKNEVVILDTILYTRIQVRYGIEKEADLKGFIVESLNKEFPTTTENVPNKGVYNRKVVKRRLISPITSGVKKISGDVMNVLVSSGFFGSGQRYSIPSNPVTITVADFPAARRPKGFLGNVGNFTIEYKVDKKSLQARTPATLAVTVKGQGNFKSLSIPDIVIDNPALEVRKSGIKDNYSATDSGYRGEKSVEYYVIPIHKGTYTLPAFSFSFFDSSKSDYIVLHKQMIRLSVSEGEKEEVTIVRYGGSGEEMDLVSKDIRYIKEGGLTIFKGLLIKRVPVYAIKALCILCIALAFLYNYYMGKYKGRENIFIKNKMYFKTKKELRNINKKIEKADDELLFKRIERAVLAYLTDKLQLNKGSSVYDIKRKLDSANIDTSPFEKLFEIIKLCQSHQYSPEESSVQQREVITDIEHSINKIEEMKLDL